MKCWKQETDLRVGLFVRAGEVVLVEVLGVEDGGTRVLRRRQRRDLGLLLVFPLGSHYLGLLRLRGAGGGRQPWMFRQQSASSSFYSVVARTHAHSRIQSNMLLW